MATKTARRRRGTVVDFTGVQAGGLNIPDGRYKAKIIEWEEKEGNESAEPYIQLEWEITSERCNGRSVKFDNHSLQPQALPFLRALLEALEYPIENKGETEIDWDGLIKDETECIIETIAVPSRDDPTKKYARIVGFYPIADGGTVDDDKDEDEPKDPGRRSSNKADEDESDEPPKRRGRPRKEEEREDNGDDEERPSNKKVKKGAKVRFKDEKGKFVKGEVESVEGDTVIIVTENEGTYELGFDEFTVIG